MKKIIIFLGVPGSGKGTQAKKIADKYGYAHVSTGDLLRTLEHDRTADPADWQKLADMKAGKLVADELIYKLAFRAIEESLARGEGVVLDGAVRTVEQAKEFQRFFEEKKVASEVLAIEIHIADATVMKRLEIRLELQGKQRADDDPEVMRKRMKEQGNKALKPILDFYRSLGVLATIDGEPPIAAVEREITKVIEGND